jgi:long-chain acyl-CoA synthetase
MTQDPILEAFDHQVHHRPERLAVVAPSGRGATVGELDATAARVTAAVGEARLGPGTPVLLSGPNGAAFVAAWIGLRRAGMPVVLVDRRTPAGERHRVASRLGAAGEVVLTDPWTLQQAEIVQSLPGGRPLDRPDVASLRLTSGSTGEPRGIAHTADALASDDADLARSMALVDDERILAAIPLSHAYGFASVLLPVLMRPSTMVVPDDDGPLAAMRAVAAGGVSFLPTVPAYIQSVLKMASPPPLPESVRLVVTAGAPLPPGTAVRFREAYGRGIHVFYGASEVGGICYDRTGTAGERGTLGEPVDGVRVRLVGDDGAEGDDGVVEIRSPAAAIGYLPEATPDLSGGVFRTSDLGRWRDGELVLTGRVDDLLNVRGKKVNPREVEAVLALCTGVDEAVVVGERDAAGAGHLVRAVVARTSGDLDVATLRAWCADRLAAHKVPRSYVLVDRIPRTERGKIDRQALRRLVGR